MKEYVYEVPDRKTRENLDVANSLHNDGYYEIAVSRAYYAMFYIAQELLYSKGLSFSSHSAVIAAFGKEFAKTGEIDVKLHRYLIEAFDTRNIGDYSMDGINKAQSQDALQWAQEFLTAAEIYLKN